MEALENAAHAAIDLLPICPFLSLQQMPISNRVLGYIAWFVPFAEIIALAQLWLISIGIWYIAKTAMRWAKAIR